MHFECRDWLQKEILSRPDKTIIVVSHHLPSFQYIASRFRGSPINSAFASDLDHLIKQENVKYWFYGHSHASRDVIDMGCNLVANPYGYSRHENTDYNRNLAVDML